MLRLTRLLFVTCVVLGISPYLLSFDRAHDLANQAASQHPASCPKTGTMTLKKCHDKFPDGCSTAKTAPSYDAYLDFLKDQDPGAALASTKDLVESDFPTLESKLTALPTPLTGKNHSDSASTFAGLGEGQYPRRHRLPLFRGRHEQRYGQGSFLCRNLQLQDQSGERL